MTSRGNAARRATDRAAGPPDSPKVRRTQLTPKEQACLRLVAKHLSSKEIAAELGIAKTSVDTYCNRARAKLGVSDRYEAARRLVSDQDPADRHFRPAAPAAVPVAITTSQDFSANRTRRSPWLGPAALMALAAVLALATLLAGLRALDVMRPPPPPTVQR